MFLCLSSPPLALDPASLMLLRGANQPAKSILQPPWLEFGRVRVGKRKSLVLQLQNTGPAVQARFPRGFACQRTCLTLQLSIRPPFVFDPHWEHVAE